MKMKTTDEDLSFLLSINDDVATIKDEANLLYIIFQKLHKLYGIKIGGGALFDKPKENLGLIIIKIEENKRMNDSHVWLQTFAVNSIPFEEKENHLKSLLSEEYLESKKVKATLLVKNPWGIPPSSNNIDWMLNARSKYCTVEQVGYAKTDPG